MGQVYSKMCPGLQSEKEKMIQEGVPISKPQDRKAFTPRNTPGGGPIGSLMILGDKGYSTLET